MTKKHYTYIYRDPRSEHLNLPRYVGKGQGGRDREHNKMGDKHPNAAMRAFFADCRRRGLKSIIERVAYFDTHEEAIKLEIELIEKYGRCDFCTGTLFNKTEGGEGVTGLIISLEQKERMRRQMYKLNADPEFVKANIKRGRNQARWLNANPEFIKAQAERGREHMQRLHLNPEFAKARDDRARKRAHKLWSDPKFRTRHLATLQTYNAARRAAKAASNHSTTVAAEQPLETISHTNLAADDT